ncbi:MAG: hypothetical protein SGI71_09820 [Verrucomicrobiota bacterium]|nr:hypothetical protein [Verrucomicrobiota bacterium]
MTEKNQNNTWKNLVALARTVEPRSHDIPPGFSDRIMSALKITRPAKQTFFESLAPIAWKGALCSIVIFAFTAFYHVQTHQDPEHLELVDAMDQSFDFPVDEEDLTLIPL